jgi:hypothetical protein
MKNSLFLVIISLVINVTLTRFYMSIAYIPIGEDQKIGVYLISDKTVDFYDDIGTLCVTPSHSNKKDMFVLIEPLFPNLDKVMDIKTDEIAMTLNWSYITDMFVEFKLGDCDGELFKATSDTVTYRELNQYLTIKKVTELAFLE